MTSHQPSQPESQSQPQPLPNSRALLTSLLTTLFTPPLPTTSNQPKSDVEEPINSQNIITSSTPIVSGISRTSNEKAAPASNPLHSLPASQKALLATLHVLFPPPMLLQALDLLDRGLVSKVVWVEGEDGEEMGEDSEGGGERREEEGVEGGSLLDGKGEGELEHRNDVQGKMQLPTTSHPPPPTSTGRPKISKPKPPTRQPTATKSITIHQVRSSQSAPSTTHPHRGRYSKDFTSNAGKVYTIHLEAWNCNCAAFAFSAFPYYYSSSSTIFSTTTTTTTASTKEHSAARGNAWGAENIFAEDNEDEWGLEFGQRREDNTTTHQDFPRRMEHRGEKSEKEDQDPDQGQDLEREQQDKWQFGGSSLTTGSDEAVPICKHLLAVLLGEKWDILNNYVSVRRVYGERGREEVAGLGVGV